MKRAAVPAVLVLLLLCLRFRPGREETAPTPAAPRSAAGLPTAPEAADLPLATLPVPLMAPAEGPTKAPEPEAETEGPYQGWLRFLMADQNDDGSWGDEPASLDGHLVGRPGLTSLAVLSMVSQGYSHLSKDTYDGFVAGDVLKKALRYLHGRMGPDGRLAGVSDVALEQALGALALSESYGLTGSVWQQEPAQRALDGLWSLQQADGSWGSRVQTDWAAQALGSAVVSDLWDSPAVTDRLRAHYERREQGGPDPGAALFRVAVLKDRKHPSLAPTGQAISARPAAASTDAYGSLYFQSRALFSCDGPTGGLWMGWKESYLKAHLSLQSRSGSWPGGTRSHRVLVNALGSINLSVIWSYRPAVFGSN
jgi:hypothetical protein